MFCMFINIGCVVTGESKLRIVCELTVYAGKGE